MKIRQIYESDYPDNKKEVLEYSSDYYPFYVSLGLSLRVMK